MKTVRIFATIVALSMAGLSHAGLIQGAGCMDSSVTAGGANADDCLGLYDKGNGPQQINATEDLLNDSSDRSPYNLPISDGWDSNGAFGRSNWNMVELNNSGIGSGIVNWSDADGPLTGDYILALKQANTLGLWYFDNLNNVASGTFDTSIFGQQNGWSNYRIFHSEDTTIPEPGSIALLGLGLIGLGLSRKRRN